MPELDALIRSFAKLPNACVLPGDGALTDYVDNELLRVFPFIEQDPVYLDFLRACDTLAIGLGGPGADDDEVEDNNFCINPVEELVQRTDWDDTRFFEIASGCYAWEIDANPCEVWYHWGFDVDEPRGVLLKIAIEEETISGPTPVYDGFLPFLREALDRKGLFLRVSEQGQPV